MTTEKMSVHKALAELKILDARIQKAMNVVFVTVNKHSNSKIAGMSIEDYKADMKSSYDKVTDLMKRRDALKRAVVLSNASTKVTIADKEYTVAEAIDMKNHSIEFKQQLQVTLSQQLMTSKAKAQQNNERLDEKSEDYVIGLFGQKDGKTNTEEVNKMKQLYIEQNTVELVDPLNVSDIIADLEDETSRFMAEVDAALSCSNATTEIEISY